MQLQQLQTTGSAATLLFSYFTIWVIVLVIISPIIYKFVDVLFLTLFVMTTSTYFLCVDKKTIHVNLFCEKYTISTRDILIFHVLVHIVPFLLIVFFLLPYYSKTPLNTMRLINTLAFCFAYLSLYDLKSTYSDITLGTIIICFVLSIFLYICATNTTC